MRFTTSKDPSRYLSILIVAMGLSYPTSISAQLPRNAAVVVGGGVSAYDLSGTGTVGIAHVGAVTTLVPSVVIEPRIALLRYNPDWIGGSHITHLFPEISVQLQVPGGPARPYLGVGIGASTRIEGESNDELTLNGEMGMRVWAGQRWGAQLEGRLRSVDPFHATTADLTLSIMFRPRSS